MKHHKFQVSVITTVAHNVGDDFVREGILYLLEQLAPLSKVELIHKHIPITTRPEWEWLYSSGITKLLDRIAYCSGLGVTSRLDRCLPVKKATDKILTADLLVQSGAPIYWLNSHGSCATTEWYKPLVRARWSQAEKRAPFINLAGGSCQPYYSDGTEFLESGQTLAHIRDFFDGCRLTTLRDDLARTILKMAGRDAQVLACTSIFARMRLKIEPQPARFVALNFMPIGGHYLYDPAFKPKVWEKEFTEFVHHLPKGEDYVFVCHNQTERDAVARLFPGFKMFFSPDYKEYIKFFASIKYGIFNRVHASFALASFGRPSFVIGSDSRALMVKRLGLNHCYIGEATADLLVAEAARLAKVEGYAMQMSVLQKMTKQAYLEQLEPIVAEAVSN